MFIYRLSYLSLFTSMMSEFSPPPPSCGKSKGGQKVNWPGSVSLPPPLLISMTIKQLGIKDRSIPNLSIVISS